MVNGAAATVSRPTGGWIETTGEQDNNWTVQVVASCDLTPGVDRRSRSSDGPATTSTASKVTQITQGGSTPSAPTATNRDFAVIMSNLPTGDLTVLDAGYTLAVTNTGSGIGKR